MKYYIKIFGCQMNYSDAERISTILEKYNFKPAASIDAASLIVFVTCGVRQSAEDRAYGQIDNVKKKYPDKKIILTGCLSHRKDVQRRLKNKIHLFTTIEDFPKEFFRPELGIRNQKSGINPKNHNSKFIIQNSKNKLPKKYLDIKPKYTNSYTAYIPIMTGCDNFCSYCVVPYARGREYSRPTEDILKEIKGLLKKGCKEIILLGQNVNSYKSSFGHPMSKRILNILFPELLQLIEKIPGYFWLTFLTSHPKDMSDELIKTIAKSKKICEYISLPAQSGDNDILKKMNRHYTVAHYKNLIKKIRKAFFRQEPSSCRLSSISTDIIVGFPGETKKQFENTVKLFREMKFDMAYINQYSPRPETAAWKFSDNVSKKEKSRRERVLTKILKKTALENNKKYIGKIVEVLVDKKSLALGNSESSARRRKKPSFGNNSEKYKYLAHTRTQKKVIFSTNKKIPIGEFIKVKISKVKAFGLEGELNQ